MAIGIASSLNATLSRLSSIESNFTVLEALSNQINSALPQTVNNSNDVKKSDFQTILEGKTTENNIQENSQNKIEDKKIDEILESNLPKEDYEPEKLEAINLKSKIDLKAQANDIDTIIDTFADKYGVDSDLIKAIIKQESGFNPKATSKKGAMGLMQLMPKTAQSLGVNDAYNPWENVEGGVKYIKGFLDKYDNNPELALAAYNAGPGAVKRYGGVPPYKETQNYVKAIMQNYNKIKGLTL